VRPKKGNERAITIPIGQRAAWRSRAFEYGTWGGDIRSGFEPQPGEIVALEHRSFSGFANTDLDLQPKRHAVGQFIVMGLIAHTCVEATVRHAAELGYEVTMVKDATADYSDVEMHAARRQYPELRQSHCDHGRNRRLNLYFNHISLTFYESGSSILSPHREFFRLKPTAVD
jgi:nicotinamidase-related amidase